MKKIHLSDGQPSSVQRKHIDQQTCELADQIKKLCKERGISYTEINKALYLVDTELYEELLNKLF